MQLSTWCLGNTPGTARHTTPMGVGRILAWATAAVLLAATPPPAAGAEDVLLAGKPGAAAFIVYSPAHGPILLNLAQVLAERIRKRTGHALTVVAEKEAEGHTAAGTIVIGTPAPDGPLAGLWQKAAAANADLASLGPGGFAILPVLAEGRTSFFLVGADVQGHAAAVGKFLRRLSFREHEVVAPGAKVLERTDPGQVMQIQQYKPAQWGNPFKDAPMEMMREYVEDQALWGSDSFWNVCCYMINNPFAPGADAASVSTWERVRDLFKQAHSLGMGIGLVDCPNSVYDDQLTLRQLGGTFVYREDVCPSIPEAHRVILENRENLYRAAHEAGIEFRYFLHFAHDNGGCGCDRCQPWIMTYIRLNEELHRLALTYHPRAKIFMTTWMLSAAEKTMMLDYIERERPAWLAGVMDRPGVALPAGYLSSGWQTIMTYGTDRTYGKMGADPMPAYLQAKVNEFRRQGIRAIFTYSEGIYDDINSAAIAQIGRHPTTFAARDFLAEYCHWNYGTEAAQSQRLAEVLADQFTAVPFAHSAHVGVKAPAAAMAALQTAEKTMPTWGRETWRYGILKDKVELECLSEKAAAVEWWLPRVKESLAAASLAGDRTQARGRVREASQHLREASAELAADVERARAVARHLYIDLYQTPRRHPVHGSFALAQPWARLIGELARRCEELVHVEDAAGFGAELEAIRARLPAELESERTITVPPNLALRRPASASSVYDERFPPAKAVDGTPIVIYTASENCWASNEKETAPGWWQVDLGEPQPVREVRVWYRNLAGEYGFVPRTVTIQLSDDGKAWRTAVQASSLVPREGSPYGRTPHAYPVQGQGRYVRLLFEDGSQRANSRVVELTEVEVY